MKLPSPLNHVATMKAISISTNVLFLFAAGVFCGCNSIGHITGNNFSYFTAVKNFSTFTESQNERGETVLLSPEIKSPFPWNQLIVSWNASVPSSAFLKVEASAISSNHHTKFYTIANWSLENKMFPRTSVRGQNDADGTVDTDTLVLHGLADAAQIRLTLGGTNSRPPLLKFLGLSFAKTNVATAVRRPNREVWGKIISTPERSQHGYPDEKGWCSPTSLSMVLSRWAQVLRRPEMDLTVPQVAAAVYDSDFAGTGNWPFNTAFAGSFNGMRSYVTRFDDISEVEDWIAAGIPVILSARWDWLAPGRPPDSGGHLIVCIGFTKDGDVVANDPATRFERGEIVRRIYKRENVIHSWMKSRNAVYLVYPENARIPPDQFGHWER